MIDKDTVVLKFRLALLDGRRKQNAESDSRWRREFHVSRESREHYSLDEEFFSLNGNVIFANFHGARVFAHRLNQKRDLVKYPEHSARAGELNAMGLIDEILHHAIFLYSEQKLKDPLQKAIVFLEQSLGKNEVDKTLRAFVESFPPKEVYSGGKSSLQYLSGSTDGQSNRAVALEELLILWLGNENPAYGKYRELFDDESLKAETQYRNIIEGLKTFFAGQSFFGSGAGGGVSLVDFLRLPALNSPHSLSGQLKYIRENWGLIFGQYLFKLLSSLDLIQEEEKITFGGPGPTKVYEYGTERGGS